MDWSVCSESQHWHSVEVVSLLHWKWVFKYLVIENSLPWNIRLPRFRLNQKCFGKNRSWSCCPPNNFAPASQLLHSLCWRVLCRGYFPQHAFYQISDRFWFFIWRSKSSVSNEFQLFMRKNEMSAIVKMGESFYWILLGVVLGCHFCPPVSQVPLHGGYSVSYIVCYTSVIFVFICYVLVFFLLRLHECSVILCSWLWNAFRGGCAPFEPRSIGCLQQLTMVLARKTYN